MPPLRRVNVKTSQRFFLPLLGNRRRCIQVTGGACKTMEAYNLAKLQQSAMPMDWGMKRDAVEAAGNDAAAENEAEIEAGDNGAVADLTKDNDAKALLFFLRPQQKVSKWKKKAGRLVTWYISMAIRATAVIMTRYTANMPAGGHQGHHDQRETDLMATSGCQSGAGLC